MKEEQLIRELEVLALKEQALSKIIAWLRGKGLWEECNDTLGITQSPKSVINEIRKLPISAEYQANRYDTDNEIVLTLWLKDGRSFDIRCDK